MGDRVWGKKAIWRERVSRLFAVLAAALILSWPALWSGFPLLFADSLEYLYTGNGILNKLRGRFAPPAEFYSNRSEIYTAVIFLLRGKTHLWPIVAVQALLTAWLLWLVVRGLRCRNTIAVYLSVVAALSVLTSVAWYASYVMPDILGPVLYLSLYLFVFAMDSLRPWERIALVPVACWATASHGSHLLVAASLCVFLLLLYLLRWKGLRRHGLQLSFAAATVLLAVAAQMATHARLYGRPSVFGSSPPFLTDRLLTDGPARLYLQTHCASLHWALCDHVNALPQTDGGLLWENDSIWQKAGPLERDRLRREETPLLLATLRTYPLQQADRSSMNFLHMLVTFGPSDFKPYPSYTAAHVNFISPGSAPAYAHSRQARDLMPTHFFAALQVSVIAISTLAVFGILLRCWPTLSSRLHGLSIVVVFSVLANAFICGVLSGPFARYQGRVVWLLPLLLAMLLFADRTPRPLSPGTAA